MRVAIIGSGIGGLGAACLLAKAGHQVIVFEKNDQLGGRAGFLAAGGFRFDTGPSWYLMPDVFEKFFAALGEKLEDHLDLIKLQSAYRVTFAGQQSLDIFADTSLDQAGFEAIEPGAGKRLQSYLHRAESTYNLAMQKVLYQTTPSFSVLTQAGRLAPWRTVEQDVNRYFQDERLRQIMQFPTVFLGTDPAHAPAPYGLLNHTLFNQGVFYPKGGMYEVVRALEKLARSYGVDFKLKAPVTKIQVSKGRVTGVVCNDKHYEADAVISNADLHHTQTELLDPTHRDHPAGYWQKQAWAPSALLLYLGSNKRYPSLRHHNLRFSSDWRQNFDQLFKQPHFPDDPSFYVCAPSRTDPTVAPKGHENLFVLVPLPAGLDYTPHQMAAYADKVLGIMETDLKLPDLRQHLVYKKQFTVRDFAERYNSFQGTALGLAHTWRQTGPLRPGNRSRQVQGLYYVGANVQPGIGLPACLVSAELVTRRVEALA